MPPLQLAPRSARRVAGEPSGGGPRRASRGGRDFASDPFMLLRAHIPPGRHPMSWASPSAKHRPNLRRNPFKQPVKLDQPARTTTTPTATPLLHSHVHVHVRPSFSDVTHCAHCVFRRKARSSMDMDMPPRSPFLALPYLEPHPRLPRRIRPRSRHALTLASPHHPCKEDTQTDMGIQRGKGTVPHQNSTPCRNSSR